jgi:uncharacterized membrane protein
MAEYDPAVLLQYTDRLYSQAKWSAFKYGFVSLFFGALVTGIVVAFVPTTKNFGADNAGQAVLVMAVVIGLIGAARGWEKAFMLRLEAQRVLCQLQIERNTRGAGVCK